MGSLLGALELEASNAQQRVLEHRAAGADEIGDEPEENHLEPGDQENGGEDQGLDAAGAAGGGVVVQEAQADRGSTEQQRAAENREDAHRVIEGVDAGD